MSQQGCHVPLSVVATPQVDGEIFKAQRNGVRRREQPHRRQVEAEPLRRNSRGACGAGLSATSIPRSSSPLNHPPATPATVTGVCNCLLRTVLRSCGPHCTRTNWGRKTMRHTSTATTSGQRQRRWRRTGGDAAVVGGLTAGA